MRRGKPVYVPVNMLAALITGNEPPGGTRHLSNKFVCNTLTFSLQLCGLFLCVSQLVLSLYREPSHKPLLDILTGK